MIRCCEACRVPMTEEEVAEYPYLCELCSRTIDRDTKAREEGWEGWEFE